MSARHIWWSYCRGCTGAGCSACGGRGWVIRVQNGGYPMRAPKVYPTTIEGIFDALLEVASEEQLANYAADDSGDESLESYRAACERHLEHPITGQEWAKAMEMIRREYGPYRSKFGRPPYKL